jgi:undecaprenyl-diphosphatase
MGSVKRLESEARRSALNLMLIVLVLFVVAISVVLGGVLTDVDRGTKALIREGRPAVLETPMWLISRMARAYVLLPLTLVGSAILWWRRERAAAVLLPALGVVAHLLLPLLKWLISKPRPTLRGYGFPSGHVFAATVFVVVAVYLLWSLEAPRRWQRAARAIGIIFVTLVGYSRIYVNAHWLSDVVGGFLVGIAFALAAVLVLDRSVGPGSAARPHGREHEHRDETGAAAHRARGADTE